MKESLWSFTPKVNISSQKLCYFKHTYNAYNLSPTLPLSPPPLVCLQVTSSAVLKTAFPAQGYTCGTATYTPR